MRPLGVRGHLLPQSATLLCHLSVAKSWWSEPSCPDTLTSHPELPELGADSRCCRLIRGSSRRRGCGCRPAHIRCIRCSEARLGSAQGGQRCTQPRAVLGAEEAALHCSEPPPPVIRRGCRHQGQHLGEAWPPEVGAGFEVAEHCGDPGHGRQDPIPPPQFGLHPLLWRLPRLDPLASRFLPGLRRWLAGRPRPNSSPCWSRTWRADRWGQENR
mmetsp:Transcript_40752/g.95705  ORF Transcript_40752/g.95705 Transcript_40752/m.95705 type:complete len:214 (+) Transcript_40752:151-792(+)